MTINAVNVTEKTGRNESCPCGSTKKYKKCCLNKVYDNTFKVRLRGCKDFHCLVTLSDRKSLHDLHCAIQGAFEWDFDHCYAFCMDNKWPRSRKEFSANPMGEGDTHLKIAKLDLPLKNKFIYWFDFGDSHLFDIKVVDIKEADDGLHNKSIVKTFGRPPDQYRHFDEDQWGGFEVENVDEDPQAHSERSAV